MLFIIVRLEWEWDEMEMLQAIPAHLHLSECRVDRSHCGAASTLTAVSRSLSVSSSSPADVWSVHVGYVRRQLAASASESHRQRSAERRRRLDSTAETNSWRHTVPASLPPCPLPSHSLRVPVDGLVCHDTSQSLHFSLSFSLSLSETRSTQIR